MNKLLELFASALSRRRTMETERRKQDLILSRVKAARDNPEFEELVMNATLAKKYQRIASIKAIVEEPLLTLPFVRGVAIGAGDHHGQAQVSPVISVFLEVDDSKHKLRDKTKDAFRQALERQRQTLERQGLAVSDSDLDALNFVATGRIIPRRSPLPFRRMSYLSTDIPGPANPVVGGVSGGWVNEDGLATSGTLGFCCYDEASLNALSYMLSNNHVLAKSNNASIGDTIVQPAPEWGGAPVGTLVGFVPIQWIQQYSAIINNYVEAAIAMKTGQRSLDNTILKIGAVEDCDYAPKIGTPVQKFGASTEWSSGVITHVDAAIKLDYDSFGEALFKHQIVTGKIANDGDSGSLLVSKEESPRAIGLIFAEDENKDESKKQNYANSILLVEAFLGIRIAPNGAALPNLGLP